MSEPIRKPESERETPRDELAPAPMPVPVPDDEPPFEVVIEEDVVPIGQIDFKSFVRWKELEAGRRATPADDRSPALVPENGVYSGVVSLLKIAGGISLVAAGVLVGVMIQSGGPSVRPPVPPPLVAAQPAPAPRIALADLGSAIASAAPLEPFGVDEPRAVAVEEAPSVLIAEEPLPSPVAVLNPARSVPVPVPVPAVVALAPFEPLGTDEPPMAVEIVAAAPPKPARPDPADILRAAVALHERGDYLAAKAAYEALLKVEPSNAKALNNLALLAIRDSALDRAEMLLKEAVAIDPAFAEAYVNLGNVQWARGSRDLAELNYRRALKVSPGHATGRLNLARLLERGGDFDDAEEEARALVQGAGAADPEAHALLGRILLRSGRGVEARPVLEQALKLEPGNVGAETDLGVVRLEAGEAEAARACFDRVIARAPRHAPAFNNRATAHAALGKIEEAKADLERALEIDPAYADAHFNYALMAERFGNFIFALEQYERVVEIDPKYARALNNLGLIYWRGKKPAEALKLFDRAVAADAALVEAQYNRGLTLVELGRKVEAGRAFERVLKALPEGAKKKEMQETIVRLTGR